MNNNTNKTAMYILSETKKMKNEREESEKVRKSGILYSQMDTDPSFLNQLLQQLDDRTEYCAIDRNGNRVGLSLISISSNNSTFFFVVRYDAGSIEGDGYVFANKEDYVWKMVHFSNNIIDHIYSCKVEREYVIDDDDERGGRWEGNVCILVDGGSVLFPFGYGSQFDENGQCVFKGIQMGKEDCMFGTTYCHDVILAEGIWIQGREFGKVMHYDLKGQLTGQHIVINGVNYFSIGDSITQMNDPSFTTMARSFRPNTIHFPMRMCFDLFSFVEDLSISDVHVSDCHYVSISHLPRLQHVYLGTYCFSEKSRDDPPYTPGRYEVIKVNQKQLVVSQCPSLISIKLSIMACSDFINVVIKGRKGMIVCEIGLPLLTSMSFGDERIDDCYCFYYSEDLQIENTPLLKTLVFGGHSFYWCERVTLSSTCYIRVVLIVDAPGLEVMCGDNALNHCSLFSCDCMVLSSIIH